MKTDPIVSEVRVVRRKILESYSWDFRKMARAAIERQNSGKRTVIAAPRTIASDCGGK
jgi:hypothetical protein